MAKIKSGQPANQGKQIKAAIVSEPNAEQSPPIFDLSRMRKGYDLTECDSEEKVAFADTLFNLSQLTWSQIKNAPRHGLGSEKIGKESIVGDSTDFFRKILCCLPCAFLGRSRWLGIAARME